MANKTLFKSLVGKLVPAANARNEERAPAYALTPKQALAQYAATGCLGATFYADAEEQLAKVLELCEKVEAEFVAKTAVYARERGLMKDMPALLLAVLAAKDVRLLASVFEEFATAPNRNKRIDGIWRASPVAQAHSTQTANNSAKLFALIFLGATLAKP